MPFVRALEARATVIVDDIVIHRPDGGRVYIRAQARPVFVAGEDVISHVVIAFIDITREVTHEAARVEAEARLARAHRMESVGSLAGGVAHDFNNLLAVVRLLTSSLRRTERDALRLEDLRSIDEVVDSAAALTRSLLAFAGRGKTRSERVPLDAIAGAILDILGRAVDKRIAVRSELSSRADVVGDGSQLEQVLMNLVVNARDALPDTGNILVKTYRLDVDEVTAKRMGRLTPGEHVALEVHDDGTGIDPSIRERIFEPYFTTKTTGQLRGTGLGLATVYGIVEGHGGAIEVLDNVPRGTLVRVLLPVAPPSAPPRRERNATLGAAESATGTVLLVEDEPLVRDAARRALVGLGYTVLVAVDGVEAVEVFRAQAGEIDVVVLDMVMPRMGGRATYRALREIDPDVLVVLTTGYARNEEAEGILDLGVRELLAKPYRLEALADVLRRLVEESTRRRAGASPEGASAGVSGGAR